MTEHSAKMDISTRTGRIQDDTRMKKLAKAILETADG